MKAGGVYSLKLERLKAERQQCLIRFLLSVASSLTLVKFYDEQVRPVTKEIKHFFPTGERTVFIEPGEVFLLSALFIVYSAAVWAMVKWRPHKLAATMAVSSLVEIALITFLIRSTAVTEIPFYVWYIFYVVCVSTRYGQLYSVLALSASIVSYTSVLVLPPPGYAPNPSIAIFLGFTGFLLVLAFMFGQMSERQLNYQASLSVVNEFRAELAVLASSKEIIAYLLDKVGALINVEHSFFLPATRGADASEAPGLRSAGADPVLLSTFRENGGAWNVEEVLREQRPILTNRPSGDRSLPEGLAAKLGLRNLAAAPMMVRATPVGVIYVANRRDKRLSNTDRQLLELVATQAAPVVENALLWERLREAAASEERLRIARDLHDNFLQTLAAMKLQLERTKIVIQKDTTRALECVERVHQVATRGLAEVRSYLSELRLMGPEPSRFREAITRCAEEAGGRGSFKIHLDIHGLDEAMPPEVALAAFQILRELLNNAVAHSKAEHVSVRVAAEDGKLVMEVEDDGIGFDVARVRAEKASQGHLGLIGVEERARQSDGTFTIASKPGKGTRATAALGL